jgi:signal transduction histidine kinase
MELNTENVSTYLPLLIRHTNQTLRTLTKITGIQDIKKKVLELVPIDLHKLWAKSLEKLKEIPNPNAEYVKVLIETKNYGGTFFSDEELLAQLICNLVDNGIRHRMQQSKKEDFVKIVLEIKDKYLLIKVADNGMGIGENIKHRIFDMFFRGSEFTSGSGMGLYIVNLIVEKLQGTITVESVSNQGSEFKVVFPSCK